MVCGFGWTHGAPCPPGARCDGLSPGALQWGWGRGSGWPQDCVGVRGSGTGGVGPGWGQVTGTGPGNGGTPSTVQLPSLCDMALSLLPPCHPFGPK